MVVLQPQTKEQMSRIILVGIVKQEAKIIARQIRSAARYVDAICLTDTGSTDDTVELIQKTGAEIGVPTKVYTSPWYGFGLSRSISAKNAREYVAELKWHPKRTFFLLLDADHELEIKKVVKDFLPKYNCFQLLQHHAFLDYNNRRLIRADGQWRAWRRTHEFWDVQDQKVEEAVLEHMWINDRDDGGSKSDKHTRDIRLLTLDFLGVPEPEIEGIPRWVPEPDGDSRSAFYLCQTYKLLDQKLLSIFWAMVRVSMAGYFAEKYQAAWYASAMYWERYLEFKENRVQDNTDQLLTLAKWLEPLPDDYTPVDADDKSKELNTLFARLKNRYHVDVPAWPHNKEELLKLSYGMADLCNKIDPARAEGYYRMSLIHRERGEYRLAYGISKAGMALPKPDTLHRLFVETWIYDWAFINEIAICGYWLRDNPTLHAESIQCMNRMMMHENAGWGPRNLAQSNFRYSIKELITDQWIKPSFEVPLMSNGNGKLRCMNPSILKTNKGYLVNVRCVNYDRLEITQVQDGVESQRVDYRYRDNSGHIKTTNVLLECDLRFKVLKQTTIEDLIGEEKGTTVFGCEDVRLFYFKKQIWFICCTQLQSNKPEQAVCRLNKKYQIIAKYSLSAHREEIAEKNWMVLPTPEFSVIYDHEPYTILDYTLNPNANELAIIKPTAVKIQELPWDLSLWRGSAPPVPFGNNYLGVIHQVLADGNLRRYYHRFVEYDLSFKPISASLPFVFLGYNVEYVSSICESHTTNQYILGVGIDDRLAWLVPVQAEYIKSLLLKLFT